MFSCCSYSVAVGFLLLLLPMVKSEVGKFNKKQ